MQEASGLSPRDAGGLRLRRRGASAGAVAPWTGTGVTVLIALVIGLQRFAVPSGAARIPLLLPVVLAGTVVLLMNGRLRVDRLKLELFVVGTVACIAATVLATALGASPSITSLGLLVFLYLPWVLRAASAQAVAFERVARGFVRVMLVVALVAIAQLATQLMGLWTYQDYLGTLVPPNLQLTSYNTNIPLEYGSAIYKANAFVFLEPSFLSQFAALAAITAVVLRAPTWQVLVLIAGVFSAVSGTGIMLLIAAGILIVLRSRHLIRPGHVVAAAVVGIAVIASPVGSLLLSRVNETSEVGSSGYLRFVQPYSEVAEGLEAVPIRYLTGAGAGEVERKLSSAKDGMAGQAVVYPIAPKLAFEYGLIAAGLFVLFIVMSLLDRGPWRVVPGSVIVMIFFLSGSLLQPHTAYLAWLLAGLWTGQDPLRLRRRTHDRTRRRSPVPATPLAVPGTGPRS